VQSLGVKGRGKIWIVVTSQEKLNELVSGLDDKRIELARLMDRFPLQVHLEPSDISEVTSKRVLAKNAAAESALGKLYDDHRGRLTENTRLTADIRLPELARQNFVDLYPLLPYQIDLIIQVVSGLRTQGGAGARRRREPHHHQARAAAPHPRGRRPRVAPRRRARPPRPGLRPRRQQHRPEIREKIHRSRRRSRTAGAGRSRRRSASSSTSRASTARPRTSPPRSIPTSEPTHASPR
jgi:hypothetical protein